jgi:hypothetical protein
MGAIVLTGADFERLWTNSNRLRTGSPAPSGQWPPVDEDGKPFSEGQWAYLYSFTDGPAIVLGRAFLESEGAPCQIIYGGDAQPDCWLVFTNFVSPSWRHSQAQQN